MADESRAHVVLCPGTRLRPRENREDHTKQLRRGDWHLFGMEKRTVHELFCGVHDDLLTTNKEEGLPLHCAGTS